MGLIRLNRRDFLWLAAPALHAQDDAVFSSDVKVVAVLASVRSKQGAVVRDLTKEDFEILENGRREEIKYFSRDTGLPLTVGMMVDTSVSQRKVLDAERGASFRFIDRVLRDNEDRFFVMQFDMSVAMRQPLTASRQKLDEALSLVDLPTRSQLRAGGWAPGTILYDAVVAACKETMTNVRGRKALVLLTDGDDTGSDHSLEDAIEAAQRADALIYSIYFSSESSRGRGPLKRMSAETGGGFFEVSKKQSFQQVFDQIEDELRSQYDLGYISDVPVRISEFRKLNVTVKRPGLVVQARDRYWARR